MRLNTLLLFIGLIAMFMIGFSEAATLKSKVQAKAKTTKDAASRAALAAAKANLSQYADRASAKAAVADAVKSHIDEKTAAYKAATENSSA